MTSRNVTPTSRAFMVRAAECPRRAPSAVAGEPYKDKLLPLPPFMLGAQAGLGAGDVDAGLTLTGHFLEQFVFGPLNRPLPPARVWMIDKLREAGRL